MQKYCNLLLYVNHLCVRNINNCLYRLWCNILPTQQFHLKCRLEKGVANIIFFRNKLSRYKRYWLPDRQYKSQNSIFAHSVQNKLKQQIGWHNVVLHRLRDKYCKLFNCFTLFEAEGKQNGRLIIWKINFLIYRNAFFAVSIYI